MARSHIEPGWPAGHFYSPIPNFSDVTERKHVIFDQSRDVLPGIDLNDEGQLNRLRELARFYDDQPFGIQKRDGLHFYFDNPNFGRGEAIVLQAMMRLLRPKRMIEIGSGFSSGAMLDVDLLYLGGQTEFLFVEPYPDLLKSLLNPDDLSRTRIHDMPVQAVDLAEFDVLEANDILFIDSSHVSKTGSDVNHIYFEILPRLKPGVFVHIHDIGYPFEYPEDWVMKGRAWNEAYLLRAFLMYNPMFTIEYYAGYLAAIRRGELLAHMPMCAETPGSSIWLRRQ